MELVVKQLNGHHGSSRFPGVAWKSRSWRGKDVSDALDRIRQH
jgi:hypothetical protein